MSPSQRGHRSWRIQTKVGTKISFCLTYNSVYENFIGSAHQSYHVGSVDCSNWNETLIEITTQPNIHTGVLYMHT